MKLVKCVQSSRCTLPCTHKTPHEPVHHGKYAYHNCRDERAIMCGRDDKGNALDGNCE